MPGKQPITIDQLYPHLNTEQLAEAEANLRRFALVLAEIYRDRSDLTLARRFSNIHTERSKPTQPEP